MEMRKGLLVTADERGRVFYRPSRKADVALAQRVVAAMAHSDDDISKYLVANLKGLGPK